MLATPLKRVLLPTQLCYRYSTAPGFRQLFKKFFKSSKPHSSLYVNKAVPLICWWPFTTFEDGNNACE
uniref:Uncharacterized protein n=1 Tax=Arundo donax TaxID=35708 RepID=A0A0A9CX05_ARUDO